MSSANRCVMGQERFLKGVMAESSLEGTTDAPQHQGVVDLQSALKTQKRKSFNRFNRTSAEAFRTPGNERVGKPPTQVTSHRRVTFTQRSL
jgi:hypothetical protein